MKTKAFMPIYLVRISTPASAICYIQESKDEIVVVLIYY